MQINPIINKPSDYQANKAGEVIDNSGAFQALLDKALGSSEAELPTAWSDNKFGNGAINNAVNFLSSKYGINANERVPTYEITSEQLEWIKTRHSSEEMGAMQPFTKEEGNLLADLVFQNIISPEDAKTMQAFLLPENDALAQMPEYGVFLSSMISDGAEAASGDYLDALNGIVGKMEELIGKYGNSGDDTVQAYIQNARTFTENKQIMYDLLTDVYNMY